MKERIRCIFCNMQADSSEEHIFPEFAGGALKIKEVCVSCNSKMGSDFEGPLSRFVAFRVPRFIHGIQGKCGEKINPFPATGACADGDKYKLSNDLYPYLVPSITHRPTENDGIAIDIRVDASYEDRIPEVLEKKICRAAKIQWPDMPPGQVDTLVEDALRKLPSEYQTTNVRPTIGYSETLDLGHLQLLLMKIAAETAYHHHQEKIRSDACFARLASAVYRRDTKCKLHGTFFPDPDPFVRVAWPDNTHLAILCANVCYVRLYEFTIILEVAERNSERHLIPEDWVVYLHNYQEQTCAKKMLIDYWHPTTPSPTSSG